MREVQLVGPAYADESLTFSAQDTVNWIPVMDESGQARSTMQLRGLPGMIGLSAEIVVSPLAIFGDAFNGTEGDTYTYTFSAYGGTPPYTFSLFSGLLPLGLSLNASTGVVSGTLTRGGTYTFTVEVTDSAGAKASVFDTIVVAGAGSGGGGGPVPDLQPAVLENPSFESGNTGWTPNTAARIALGAAPVSPGYVITNSPGRTGAWVMNWTGSPAGKQDTCFNGKVANTFAQDGVLYQGTAWIRCTAFSSSGGNVQAAVLMEKFSDEACTIPAGSAVSSFITFFGVNTTWTNVTSFIPSGGYIRLSLIVTQGINVPLTATIEFDDVTWNVQEIVP